MNNKQIDAMATTLLNIIRKEWESMVQVKRKITEEQAQNVIQHNNWEGIFDISEVCGYGVYGEEIRKEEDGNYYVIFMRGDSCD